MATLGMASAFSRKCKACGHMMSLHGSDNAPAERPEARTARDPGKPLWRQPTVGALISEAARRRRAEDDQDSEGPRADGPDPAPYAAPAAPASPSVADELRKLAELRDAGVLSAAEFDAQKARLLG